MVEHLGFPQLCQEQESEAKSRLEIMQPNHYFKGVAVHLKPTPVPRKSLSVSGVGRGSDTIGFSTRKM